MKHSFYSDADRTKAFLSDIKNRSIETKHLYINNGADSFYSATEMQLESKKWAPEYISFLKNNILQNIHKDAKFSFISLGCGKDEMSKEILTEIEKEGYNFEYCGIDVSEKMLELNKTHFEDVSFQKSQILADFSGYNLKGKLDTVLSKDSEFKIFAFFGATIGNIKLTNSSDTFQNVLDEGDFLWNDCVVQENNSPVTQMHRFNYYLSFFQDKEVVDFLFNPLEKIGISLSSGKFYLNSASEKSVGTILYTMGFTFTEMVRINYLNNNIVFLPEEEIELLFIRDYTPEPFMHFFQYHNLEPIAHWKEKTLGQFLFQKQ